MIVALFALVLAIGGTGYASQLRSGRSLATTAKRATKPACVSGVSLCHKLRSAVDRQIAAYFRTHRKLLVGPQGGQGGQGPAGASGSAGAPGAAGVGISGIFGNGADGSQSITGNTTLTRDMYYADLTVNPGVNLNTGGFRIFVSGTLTLGGGSRISRDGLNATASSPAAGLTPGSLGGSGPGANMSLCAGGGTFNSLGGAGGTGRTGCPGGIDGQPATSVGGAQAFDAGLVALSGRTLDGVIVSGGSGGGGGTSSAGNGGSGGGVAVVAARSVSVPSSASITAIGGGNAGDGGGGGGGVVVVVSASPQPPGLTLSAAGGGSAPHTGEAGFANWFS